MSPDILVHTLVGWCVVIVACSPKGAAKRLRVLVALGVCAAFAVGAFVQRSPNYFEMLGLTPEANTFQIEKALERAMNAAENDDISVRTLTSHEIKRVKAILLPKATRKAYGLYGDYLQTVDLTESTAPVAILNSASMNVLLFVLGYLLCTPTQFRLARKVAGLACLGMFTMDLQLRQGHGMVSFVQYTPLGAWLPFEQVQLLYRLFPAILMTAQAVSFALFVDKSHVELELLRCVYQTNRELCEKLLQISKHLERSRPSDKPLQAAIHCTK
ncbi:MAG: hypothetical protein KVP17_000699 [Porospora cf. gigantea B]|uniref:uncharacterized protein n=1 Tax=Porospora cf. gigantea B TaxID=2853592 RepID=UPI0035718949|nr:MAG: hypothetical protein KVP17_000699 [Porospora cf. gigantea B]